MKTFKIGDKQKAICENCRTIQNAIFQFRDVPYSDGTGLAKNILAGACEKCSQVVVIPQQSVEAISKQYNT